MQESDAEDFFQAVRSFGASDVGIARVGGVLPDADANSATDFSSLPFAVSIVVRLSDAIIDEIGSDGPTYTYFNHYRSVNYLIDQILLKTGLWLQSRGARYITVAASQSRPDSPFEGRYSHKKAACLAGLGFVGLNGLFLHTEWGPRVRLGTVFTDWKGVEAVSASAVTDSTADMVWPCAVGVSVAPFCADCGACVRACPAGAIGGNQAAGGNQATGGTSLCGTSGNRLSSERIVSFDPARCSAWMKKAYQNIGRGAVCGICIAVCPAPGRCASS